MFSKRSEEKVEDKDDLENLSDDELEELAANILSDLNEEPEGKEKYMSNVFRS